MLGIRSYGRLWLENVAGKWGIIWYVFLKYKSDIRHSIVLHVAAECECIIHAADKHLSCFALLAFNEG